MARFVDEISLIICAGNGGNGGSSFFQDWKQKNPRPDGGNGGKGGSIIFIATNRENSLNQFRPNQSLIAQTGKPGKSKKKDGANAPDLIFYVPLGTLFLSADRKELLVDLSKENQRFIAAVGGKGGRGNSYFFQTSRLATHSEAGTIGEQKKIHLELKIIASIGLIGLPNAGKSSLLQTLTAAQPEINSYAFTTLVPNLGVLQNFHSGEKLTIADLPGLISGAASNKGLGNRFLRHAERCQLLIHLVDFAENSFQKVEKNIEIINIELKAYNPLFVHIPKMIVANKLDLSLAQKNFATLSQSLAKNRQIKQVSVKQNKGINDLVASVFRFFRENSQLQTVVERAMQKKIQSPKQIRISFEKAIKLQKLRPNTWEVSGKLFADLFKVNNPNTAEGLKKINSFLRSSDLRTRIEKEGIRAGDILFIFGSQFTWTSS